MALPLRYASQTTCAGVLTSTTPSAGYRDGVTQSMTDWIEPNFIKRQRQGDVMNHPMHSIKTVCSGVCNSSWTITYTPACSGATIKSQAGTGNRAIDTGLPGNAWSLDFIEREMSRLQLLVGTQAKAGVKMPEFRGGLAAAQLDKTLKLLLMEFKAFRKTIFNLARSQAFRKEVQKSRLSRERARGLTAKGIRLSGKEAKASKQVLEELTGSAKALVSDGLTIADFLGTHWLAARFGLGITAMNIEALSKLAETPVLSPRLTSRAKSSVTSGVINSSTTYPQSIDGYFSGSTNKASSVTIEVSCGILYEHEMSVSDRAGFGLANLAPDVWEIIPYSFIVDRFVNIGSFISSISPKTGVKYLAEWTKTTVTYDKVSSWSASPGTPVKDVSVSGSLLGTSKETVFDTVRVPIVKSGLTWTNFLHDGRGLKESLYVKQIVDEIALIVQISNRKFH